MRVGIAVYCEVCKRMKKPHGRSAPLAASYCDEECDGYHRMPFAGCLWPNENEKEFGNKICRDATRQVPDEAVKGGGVMGCNADKDTRSDVPCTHRRVLECQDCRCTFAVRYTDDAIQSLLDRVKELESKLGAALSGISSVGATVGSGRHDATSDHNDTQQAGKAASGPLAAPSVSAEYWHHSARAWEHTLSTWDTSRNIPSSHSIDAAKNLARAYHLAAAVTEWYKRPHRGDADEADLYDLIRAFVRGEPLPQKGG